MIKKIKRYIYKGQKIGKYILDCTYFLIDFKVLHTYASFDNYI